MRHTSCHCRLYRVGRTEGILEQGISLICRYARDSTGLILSDIYRSPIYYSGISRLRRWGVHYVDIAWVPFLAGATSQEVADSQTASTIPVLPNSFLPFTNLNIRSSPVIYDFAMALQHHLRPHRRSIHLPLETSSCSGSLS